MSRNDPTIPDFPSQSAQSQAGASLPSVQDQLDAMAQQIEAMRRDHHHNGSDGQPIALETDIRGLFQTVSTVPTNVPRNVYEQMVIYTNGTTYRLYWYDAANHAWRYASGT